MSIIEIEVKRSKHSKIRKGAGRRAGDTVQP